MAASDSVRSKTKKKTDLVHLRSLPELEPATSTGRVAWIWPEIEAGLATGKRLHEVWEAACADGLVIPYPQFRVYVSRLRRRSSAQRNTTQLSGSAAAATTQSSHDHATVELPPDPFQNLRARLSGRGKGIRDLFDPLSV
jgi:hypothetical protein